jgi:hypothetical protein
MRSPRPAAKIMAVAGCRGLLCAVELMSVVFIGSQVDELSKMIRRTIFLNF